MDDRSYKHRLLTHWQGVRFLTFSEARRFYIDKHPDRSHRFNGKYDKYHEILWPSVNMTVGKILKQHGRRERTAQGKPYWVFESFEPKKLKRMVKLIASPTEPNQSNRCFCGNLKSFVFCGTDLDDHVCVKYQTMNTIVDCVGRVFLFDWNRGQFYLSRLTERDVEQITNEYYSRSQELWALCPKNMHLSALLWCRDAKNWDFDVPDETVSVVSPAIQYRCPDDFPGYCEA
jgi:hypothetical protein